MEVISYLLVMKHLAYLPIHRNSRLIMKKITLTLVALFGLMSYLSAQVEVGDGGSNFTEFELDGTMVFHGESTVFNDLENPLTAGTIYKSPPSFEVFMDDGSGRRGVYAYSFGNAQANNEEQIMFTIQMPHGWIEGSDIYPHIHWSPRDNGSGVVVWGIEYTWVDYNSITPGEFPPTTTITAESVAIANDNHKHLVTSFGAITPSADQDNISSILMVRVFRNSSNPADTYSDEAFGLSFDLHYEMNTIGSRTEWTK